MAVRRRLAYQPEQPAFPATLTCAEVVRLHAALVGDIRCSDVLERCGLGERRQTPVGSLSKGQQTRLSLALTLLGTPEVFVLDEPMSGLDPLGRDFVRGLVREHAARGATVLFSSHALADVEALCDSITVIHGGRVLLDAPVHDLGRGHGEDVVEIAVAAPPDWRPPDDLFGERNGALWVTRTTQDPLPIASRLVQSGGQIVHLLRARPRLEDVVIGLLREAPGP
jgi:ABC-2 type transport system ATP-binding protein